MAAGVQVQKRLILEHAVRVHPQLLAKARELECGIEVAMKEPPMDNCFRSTIAAKALRATKNNFTIFRLFCLGISAKNAAEWHL